MDEKNFLNIHVLISHSPSCLNRDDANMQKSAVFGGTRRVRISSQCLKYWMRKSHYFKDSFPGVSTRTRAMAEEIEKELKGKTQMPEKDLRALVVEAMEVFVAKPSKEKLKKGRVFTQVVPWTDNEKQQVINVLEEIWKKSKEKKADETEKEKTKNKSKKKDRKEDLKKAFSSNKNNIANLFAQGSDISLFGRMTTSSLMPKVDGAVSVAHSITTHSVDGDIDYFVAVDDLVEEDVSEDPDQGAGHINTQEFGSGVFYRYASLNIQQLQKNIGSDTTREQALDISSHLVHMLATIVPDAKQRSFAAYNPADLVLASFSDLPVSAANAFERPVEHNPKGGSGFIQPSIDALEDYWNKVHKGYGLNDRQAAFSLWDTKLKPRKNSLSELEDWIRKGGENGNG
ncbi:MAG: type I-E CRISPR-associated protein Cas7/Cse4/CasC [Nitrospinales bacterium]